VLGPDEVVVEQARLFLGSTSTRRARSVKRSNNLDSLLGAYRPPHQGHFGRPGADAPDRYAAPGGIHGCPVFGAPARQAYPPWPSGPRSYLCMLSWASAHAIGGRLCAPCDRPTNVEVHDEEPNWSGTCMTWRTAHRLGPGLSDQKVRTVTSALRASTVAPPKATVAVLGAVMEAPANRPIVGQPSAFRGPDAPWSRTKRPVRRPARRRPLVGPGRAEEGLTLTSPRYRCPRRRPDWSRGIDERQQRRCLPADCP